MKRTLVKFLFVAMAMAPADALAASNSFSFDGTLIDGGSPMSSPQNLTFGIYSQGGTCLLYEETISGVPIDATTGAFSVQVGSGVRTGNDSGHAWGDLFKNSGTIAGLAACSYTPAIADGRQLEVTVGANPALSPKYAMTSVPMAKVAESINGLTAPDLLLVNGTANLSQSNLESIFNGGNLTTLQALIGGTSSLYAKNVPTAAVSMNGQSVTNVAAPSAGTDAANKNYSDGYIGGRNADSGTLAGLGGGGDIGKVMSWNGTQWTAVAAPADNTKLPLAGGTMTGAIDMGGFNFLATGHITMSPQKTLNLGTYTNAQEATLVAALAAIDKGKFWYNTDAGVLKFWDGSAAQSLSTGSGVTDLTGDVVATGPGSAAAVIAMSAINSAKIADGAVGTADLADNSVNSSKILDGSVVDSKIISVSVNKLTSGAGLYLTYAPNGSTCPTGNTLVWTASNRWECAAAGGGGTVTDVTAGTGLTGGTITGSGTISINAGGVTATELAASAVTNGKLANDAVTSAKILDGDIALGDLAADSVDASKIVDNSITTADIGGGSVTDAKISSVGVDKIISGAGNYFGYAPNGAACANGQFLSWDNANTRWICGSPAGIGAGAVTSTELATSSVSSAKIVDGTISTADLAISAITSALIDDSTITLADMAVSSVDSSKIVDGTIVSVDVNNINYSKLSNASGSYLNYMPNSVACSNAQVLSWDNANLRWVCANDNAGVTTASGLASAPLGGLSSTDTQSALYELDSEKLGSALSSANIFVGNGSNVATGVSLSGDATISNAGALTIANSAVTDAKIASMNVSKLANGAGLYFDYRPNNTQCANNEYLSYNTGTPGWQCTTLPGPGAGTINSAALATSSVDSSKIADETITTSDILNGTIATVDLAASSVTSAKIADGTIDPSVDIGAGTAAITIQSGTGGASTFGNNAGGATTTLRSGTGGTTVTSLGTGASAVSITSAGTNSGITLTPNGTGVVTVSSGGLVVSSGLITGNGSGLTGVTAANVQAGSGSAGAPSISFSGDTDTGIFRPTADNLGFSTQGSERMRLDPSGNVGIGTPSPTAKLEVNGSVKLTGTVAYPIASATYQTASGNCNSTNTCIQLSGPGTAYTVSAASVSGSLTCISTGTMDGQMLILMVDHTSGAPLTITSSFGTCSAGFSKIHLYVSAPLALSSGNKGTYQFIWDNPGTAWRLISSQ